MVIMTSTNVKEAPIVPEVEKRRSPYVYLVDNEQDMMLILKRNLDKFVSRLNCFQELSLSSQ